MEYLESEPIKNQFAHMTYFKVSQSRSPAYKSTEFEPGLGSALRSLTRYLTLLKLLNIVESQFPHLSIWRQ